jgi:hypothetical protein
LIEWAKWSSTCQQKDEKSMPTYSHGTTIPEMASLQCASTHLSSRHRLFRFHGAAA